MQQSVDDGACAVALGGLAVGGLELSEDLRFAENQGIQTGGHVEQVPDGFVVLVLIEVGFQFLDAVSAGFCPAFEGASSRQVALADHEHFHAVAGGEDERLADAVSRGDGPGVRSAEVGEREFFAHVHRGGAVVDAYEVDGAVHDGPEKKEGVAPGRVSNGRE